MCSPSCSAESISFEKFLDEVPDLDELLEFIRVPKKWYSFGVLLKIDTTKLDAIDQNENEVDAKMCKMFKIWRNENGLNASRRLILETLQKRTIERNDIVHEYMQALKTKCQYDFIF